MILARAAQVAGITEREMYRMGEDAPAIVLDCLVTKMRHDFMVHDMASVTQIAVVMCQQLGMDPLRRYVRRQSTVVPVTSPVPLRRYYEYEWERMAAQITAGVHHVETTHEFWLQWKTYNVTLHAGTFVSIGVVIPKRPTQAAHEKVFWRKGQSRNVLSQKIMRLFKIKHPDLFPQEEA